MTVLSMLKLSTFALVLGAAACDAQTPESAQESAQTMTRSTAEADGATSELREIELATRRVPRIEAVVVADHPGPNAGVASNGKVGYGPYGYYRRP